MAEGLKYPKELTDGVNVTVDGKTYHFHEALRDLAIVPFFGFWGVQEILHRQMGSEGVAAVRNLAGYPTLKEAKAYLEGFMAGNAKRSKEEIELGGRNE